MLYTSKLDKNSFEYKNAIIKIEDDYRVGDIKDFYDKWNKLTKDNGVFESWVTPYNFESKAFIKSQLKPITQDDSSFIFNQFLEILRHNVVSDKGNAFNKIFTLFLCKVYDETSKQDDEELDFQWKEGQDNHVSFQLRLSSKMCRVNKTISRAQIQNILKNTFYIGYFKQKGKVYKHNYPLFIDENLFRIVQDTMEGRKRAPSKLYYGDKQYVFTGLVRCGCCGSLMTCETKVKDDKHSYNYLKCNKLRSKCSQKPLNEVKILAQLEKELSLPLAVSDDMLKNIKAEVKKQLKEERVNTATLKRDITIKINQLDEQLKTLFRGYIQGKCDEKMYNELKTEIELEKEKLQKDMDRYLEIDAETDEILANIAEIAANVGKFLKSPIISEKRDILKLILSDCKTEGKNIAFSIVKPFNELLKTPETDKWCRWQESDLRPRHYQ